MGWNFVTSLSNHHELHVITEEAKWKKDIENELANKPGLRQNLKFYYIRKKRNRLLRKIWPPSYYIYYRMWQRKAYKLAVELDKKENFNLIHQLNMVGFREPGYLWKINKPFVWGPIGGLEDVSFKLLLNLDLTGVIYYITRTVINKLQKRFYRRPLRAATRDHSCLIAATRGEQSNIRKYWNRDSTIIPEVGREIYNGNSGVRSDEESLRIVWSGQHTAGKALNILLKGLIQLPPEIKWHLSILGSGRKTESWKSMAQRAGIAHKCTWHSWIERKDAQNIMKKSHVICITSIKDLTSTVTMEGLSLGLPVICLDHCGFGNVVNDTCGIKIAVDYPERIVRGFRDAIQTLYTDEPYRRNLSAGALKRASEFSWEQKTMEINRIYDSLTDHSSTQPADLN